MLRSAGFKVVADKRCWVEIYGVSLCLNFGSTSSQQMGLRSKQCLNMLVNQGRIQKFQKGGAGSQILERGGGRKSFFQCGFQSFSYKSLTNIPAKGGATARPAPPLNPRLSMLDPALDGILIYIHSNFHGIILLLFVLESVGALTPLNSTHTTASQRGSQNKLGECYNQLNDLSNKLLLANTNFIAFFNAASNSFQILYIGATTAAESLFTYPVGKSHASYMNLRYAPIFIDQQNIVFPDKQKENEARAICGSNKQCLFDIHLTGKMDIGRASSRVSNEFEAVVKETKKKGKNVMTTFQESLFEV